MTLISGRGLLAKVPGCCSARDPISIIGFWLGSGVQRPQACDLPAGVVRSTYVHRRVSFSRGGHCTDVLQKNSPMVRTSYAGGQSTPLGLSVAIELVDVARSRSTPCRSRARALACRGSSVPRRFVERYRACPSLARDDSSRQRLGRTFRSATSRRWDPIQAVCTDKFLSLAWQEIAQDKVRRQAPVAACGQRGLRGTVVPMPPRRRVAG